MTIDPDNPSKTITNVDLKVDKDSEDFFTYQIKLKKYIDNMLNNTDNLQLCFTTIIGQNSHDIEQLLKSETTFDDPKKRYDSVGLMKLIEKLCFNYHAHEYTLLGAWEGIN